MARYGDRGAYELGNVRICLNRDNSFENKQHHPINGERNPMYGKSIWDLHTPETRERHLAAVVKRNKMPISLATRAKMSAKAKARRVVRRDGRRTCAFPGDSDYPGAAI